MSRRNIAMILAALLAAIYAFQMYESYAAGEGVRWIHSLGLLAATGLFVAELRAKD